MLDTDAGVSEIRNQQSHTGGVQAQAKTMNAVAKKVCVGNCNDENCVCEHEHEFVCLDEAVCPHKFGHLSKELLLTFPQCIGKVIARANRFSDSVGGKALLERLKGVRRMQIDRMSESDRERVLRRAFRRSGPTLEPYMGYVR